MDVSELRIFQGADMDKLSTPKPALYNTGSIVVTKHPTDVREVALREFAGCKWRVAANALFWSCHSDELNGNSTRMRLINELHKVFCSVVNEDQVVQLEKWGRPSLLDPNGTCRQPDSRETRGVCSTTWRSPMSSASESRPQNQEGVDGPTLGKGPSHFQPADRRSM